MNIKNVLLWIFFPVMMWWKKYWKNKDYDAEDNKLKFISTGVAAVLLSIIYIIVVIIPMIFILSIVILILMILTIAVIIIIIVICIALFIIAVALVLVGTITGILPAAIIVIVIIMMCCSAGGLSCFVCYAGIREWVNR